MKKIMLLGCFMCSAFAWADYEHCVELEQKVFDKCLSMTINPFRKNDKQDHCSDAYKFGLSQCKEVYINKRK